MRVGISIPVEEGLPIERLVDLAREAERCGYDTVVAGEVAGPDVFALLTAIAVATERVAIGTGVVPMSTRPVGLLAMGFQTLASLAPGRVVAGVGVSSPTVIERWHGGTFAPPIAYVREFLPALRQALDGEKLALDGKYVRSKGFRTTLPQGAADPGRRRGDAPDDGRPLGRARRRRVPHLVPARGGCGAGRARPRGCPPGGTRPGRAADHGLVLRLRRPGGRRSPGADAALRDAVRERLDASRLVRALDPESGRRRGGLAGGRPAAGRRADLRRFRRPARPARRRRDRGPRPRPPRGRDRPADHGRRRRLARGTATGHSRRSRPPPSRSASRCRRRVRGDAMRSV